MLLLVHPFVTFFHSFIQSLRLFPPTFQLTFSPTPTFIYYPPPSPPYHHSLPDTRTFNWRQTVSRPSPPSKGWSQLLIPPPAPGEPVSVPCGTPLQEHRRTPPLSPPPHVRAPVTPPFWGCECQRGVATQRRSTRVSSSAIHNLRHYSWPPRTRAGSHLPRAWAFQEQGSLCLTATA